MQITNELIELVCAECAARPGVERNWPGDFTAEELADSRETVRIGLEAAARIWGREKSLLAYLPPMTVDGLALARDIEQAQAEAAARTAEYLREG